MQAWLESEEITAFTQGPCCFRGGSDRRESGARVIEFADRQVGLVLLQTRRKYLALNSGMGCQVKPSKSMASKSAVVQKRTGSRPSHWSPTFVDAPVPVGIWCPLLGCFRGVILAYPAKDNLPSPILRRTIFCTARKGQAMRICIYKSDDEPHLTLFLREGAPVPENARKHKWRHFKAVTRDEVRADLLKKIEVANGYLFVQLGSSL